MVTRHQQIDFASGATVFPGGKVNVGDEDPRVRDCCSGVDGLSNEQLSLRVAAIREAFEESGILLARRRGESAFIDKTLAADIGARYRTKLDKAEIGIHTMLAAEDLELACEHLIPFAHWITPTFVAKRFNTHFFVAAAPTEQIAIHDGKETIDASWINPIEALSQAQSGARTMVVATKMNVHKLAASNSVAAALGVARSQPVVTVVPELVQSNGQRRLRIPVEAGYGQTEIEL